MAKFDFDVTIVLTHTQTIEADSLEEAKAIVGRLSDTYYFITDMYEELTTDYDGFDSDHMTIGEPEPCKWPEYSEVTIDQGDYIKE